MVRRLSSLVALGLLLGCGPSSDDYEFVREAGCEDGCDPDAGTLDAGPPVIPDEPLEPWDEAGAGPLTGIFAVEVITPARAVIDLEVRQLYRLRILQRDDVVRTRINPCRFLLPSVPGVATLTIPPRLETILRAIFVEDEGPFLSSTDPIGATLVTPTSRVVLGARLDDPINDPLPTMDMLDNQLDQDMDGNPGVTIDVDTALCRMTEEAYVALRTSVRMIGVVEDFDTITGSVEPTLEQSILGISDRCLAAATTLDVEILEGSTFSAIRVGTEEDFDENGNVTCPEIVLHAPRLFGDAWSM